MTGPVRVLLVDAGGVLFTNVNEETSFLHDVAVHHGVEPQRFAAAVTDTQAEYESDRRDVHDVLAAAVRSAVPYDRDWVDRRYLHCVQPHETVFAHVRRLRTVPGRPELVLANNEARHWDALKDGRFAHLGLFDRVCSSWVLRAVKPHPDYLDGVLAACAAHPAECLLVDDRAVVVEQARRHGIRTVHLTDPTTFPGLVDAALGLLPQAAHTTEKETLP